MQLQEDLSGISTPNRQEQINFKMQIQKDTLIRKKMKSKGKHRSLGFKNNLSSIKSISPLKPDMSPMKSNLVIPHHKRIETDKNDKLSPYIDVNFND